MFCSVRVFGAVQVFSKGLRKGKGSTDRFFRGKRKNGNQNGNDFVVSLIVVLHCDFYFLWFFFLYSFLFLIPIFFWRGALVPGTRSIFEGTITVRTSKKKKKKKKKKEEK